MIMSDVFKIVVPETWNTVPFRRQIENPEEIEDMVFDTKKQAELYLLKRFGSGTMNCFKIEHIHSCDTVLLKEHNHTTIDVREIGRVKATIYPCGIHGRIHDGREIEKVRFWKGDPKYQWVYPNFEK